LTKLEDNGIAVSHTILNKSAGVFERTRTCPSDVIPAVFTITTVGIKAIHQTVIEKWCRASSQLRYRMSFGCAQTHIDPWMQEVDRSTIWRVAVGYESDPSIILSELLNVIANLSAL
jgi:hypothetical protein